MKHFDEYATLEKNKEKYKELCLQHHPDRKGGSTKIMAEINGEWETAKKQYAAGLLPKIKQTPPKERTHYNVFGGKIHQAQPAQNPATIIYTKVPFRRKKYSGTEAEIYMNVIKDFGIKAGIEFIMAFQKKKSPQVIEVQFINLFNNLFK